MDTGTLKKVRTIAPGTIILVSGIPLYSLLMGKPVTLTQGFGAISAGVGVIIAYGVGALYNLFNFRAVFNGASHQRITANIKTRLLQIGREMPLSENRRKELLEGTELMDVFYYIVDSNDSLKERSKLVRDNGLVWSTIADLVVLGSISCAFYLPLWYATGYTPFFYWSIASGLIAAFSARFLHPTAERKHIKLGNEQLDFMAVNLKAAVRDKVDEL